MGWRREPAPPASMIPFIGGTTVSLFEFKVLVERLRAVREGSSSGELLLNLLYRLFEF